MLLHLKSTLTYILYSDASNCCNRYYFSYDKTGTSIKSSGVSHQRGVLGNQQRNRLRTDQWTWQDGSQQGLWNKSLMEWVIFVIQELNLARNITSKMRFMYLVNVYQMLITARNWSMCWGHRNEQTRQKSLSSRSSHSSNTLRCFLKRKAILSTSPLYMKCYMTSISFWFTVSLCQFSDES